MSLPLARTIAVSLLVGGALLLGIAPAHAAQTPAKLALEVAGPDGVFVPVAKGAQFAVSSITVTTARWTITNPSSSPHTGYYLYSYGPDCAVSDITIGAGETYVCTEEIAPPSPGIKNLGALGGLFESGIDFAIAYPIVVDVVDDTAGQSLVLSESTVGPEGTLVITGSGFDEDDELTGILTSTPINLGSFALTGGAFSYTLTLPPGFAPGTHTVTLYSNGVAYAARTFVVTGPQLAASGVDGTPTLLLGGGLLGLGVALLMSGRPGAARLRSLRQPS